MGVYGSGAAAETRSVLAALLPIMAAVFVAFLVTGIAMPMLPLHVHDSLGLGTFAVGLVAGAQFTASLLSRFFGYSNGLVILGKIDGDVEAFNTPGSVKATVELVK
jgi:hypothetical protein